MPGELIQALRTGADGVNAGMQEQANLAARLANANSAGYKATELLFAEMHPIREQAAGVETGDNTQTPTPLEIAGGPKLVSTQRNYKQGTMKQTGVETDLSIQGTAFWEVTKGAETFYTKAGAMQINAAGEWTVMGGAKLGSGFQPVNDPGNRDSIGVSPNGTVTVVSTTGDIQTFQVQVARFPNPQGLESVGNSLFRKTTASGEAILENPTGVGGIAVVQGSIELGNTDVVGTMAGMMANEHFTKSNVKGMQGTDTLLQASIVRR